MKNLQINFKPLVILLLVGFVFSSCSSDDDVAPAKTNFQVTINASPNNGGTVSPQSGEFEKDQLIDITAIPADGWGFKEWQGDVTGTENPVQLTVNGAKTVTAVFIRNLFYLAENGVTVKAPDATVGDSGVVNGVTYTKRTADQITPDNAETTCTTGIVNMSALFINDTTFNGDISHWDVSSVTTMFSMFRNAESFNQNLSDWDVSSVTNMSQMFYNSVNFNGDLSNWDVSNVTDMSYMFWEADVFNGDISNWDVSGVTTMYHMFRGANIFNSDLGNWNVSSVTDMAGMFTDATSFNHSLNGWNVGRVTNMQAMFSGTTVFNGNISNWDVSRVTNMDSMFFRATIFNQNLTSWCVINMASEPNNFANFSALTNSNKPAWGFCL